MPKSQSIWFMHGNDENKLSQCVLHDIREQKKYRVSSFWCSNPVQLSSQPFPLSTFEGESRSMVGIFVLSL
jgi:hypothetical protein